MPNLPEKEELQALFPNLEIEYLVAQGGMGAVYRAIQQPLGRAVAIKILPPEFAADKMRKVRFGIEAKAMAKLSHPNIVQLYDFGETEGISWMIQEWIEGKTLHQIGHEGGLPAEEAAALVCQVCAGLGHAHQNGVVHRDVKPANIILNSEGKVKLTDFGLARAVKGGANSLISTMGSCRYGTAEYAAPEVWDEGAVIDLRADIFSLGVLLYESLTGKLPSGVFQQPSEIKPSLDPRFDDIIIRSMQGEPQNRYQSCKEFSAAIRQLLDVPTGSLVETAVSIPDTQKLATNKPALLNTQPVTLQANPLNTAPVTVKASPLPLPVATQSRSSSGMISKLVLIVVLIALVGIVWKISQNKMAKVDEQQDRADARLAKELESREEIKKQIEAERNARMGSRQNRPENPQKSHENPSDTESTVTGNEADQEMKSNNETDTTASRTASRTADSPAENKPQMDIPELQDLNKKLIAKAKPHLDRYDEAIASLGIKYLEQCKKEDKKAGDIGDLDALLFWQNEVEVIKKTGEPPRELENIPARAATLRKAWHNRMDKLKKTIIDLQNIYLGECQKLADKLSSDKRNKDAGLLSGRIEQAKKFSHFIKICSGEELPSVALIVPGDVALASKGTKILNTDAANETNKDPNFMLDRIDNGKDNYFGTSWPKGPSVDLGKIYQLGKIRFKLWNFEGNRYYRYLAEVSTDGENWELLADRTKGESRGWQEFPLNRPVRYIKFSQTYNSKNDGFHICELEAFCVGH